MEISGKLKMIGETLDVGTSGFQKRDCVITTDEQYPQDIIIQFVQDKCNILSNFNVGESVTIGINLRGREWTNPKGELVYFNTIQGWKINKTQQGNQNTSAPAQQQQYPPVPSNSTFGINANVQANNSEEPDDLPF